MDETYNTTGIVIKNEPWREYDSRIVVYTADHGKLELVARGTKKIKSKLAGHLEPATLINLMVIRGRLLDYVGFAHNLDSYLDSKSNWESMTAIGKAFGAFNQLIKTGVVDERLYGLLEDFLTVINIKHQKINFSLMSNFFIFKLLTALGYKPELYNCLICKSKIFANNKQKFDIIKGGLICPKCQNKLSANVLTISDNCLKILRTVLNRKLREIIKIKIERKLAEETRSTIEHYHEVYQNL